jgi:hypothetical protein
VKLFGLDGCKHNAWVVAEADPEFSAVTFRIETNLSGISERHSTVARRWCWMFRSASHVPIAPATKRPEHS